MPTTTSGSASPLTSPMPTESGGLGYVPTVSWNTGAASDPPGVWARTTTLKSTAASPLYPVVTTASARPSPVTSPIATASGCGTDA